MIFLRCSTEEEKKGFVLLTCQKADVGKVTDQKKDDSDKVDDARDVHHRDDPGVELGWEAAAHHTAPGNNEHGVARDIEDKAEFVQHVVANIGDNV